jgi:ribonuclease HI
MKNRLLVHTDGGARGNPGPAGAGAVVFDESGKVLYETSEYLGIQTNNFAEYSAVVLGLELVAKKIGKARCKDTFLTVRLDSELICKQLNNEYQIKEQTLFPLYIRVHNLLVSTFPNVTFEHVPRAQNAHADRLANEAMDKVS